MDLPIKAPLINHETHENYGGPPGQNDCRCQGRPSALAKLRRLVDAVNRPGEEKSEFDQALYVLKTLSRKEGIPIAIVGGMAAIRYGYERLTNDLDLVIARQHLDTILRVAPRYGIKVLW